jgi:LPXTG-motif cell wall-anchored protein
MFDMTALIKKPLSLAAPTDSPIASPSSSIAPASDVPAQLPNTGDDSVPWLVLGLLALFALTSGAFVVRTVRC